jgi:hypothetical protein
VKKVLLLVSALLIVFSGVAAVSAYEAHTVNVKVEVENALGVEKHWDLGVTFPQADLEYFVYFGLSESFRNQDPLRFSTVEYDLYWKLKPEGDADLCAPYVVGGEDYYYPLFWFASLSIDSVDYPVPSGDPNDCDAWYAGSGKSTMDSTCERVTLNLDPPVFEGYYDECLDPKDASGVIPYAYYCEYEETICPGDHEFKAMVPHVMLGGDLIIQVTKIKPHSPGTVTSVE